MFLHNTPVDLAKVYYHESFAIEELNFQRAFVRQTSLLTMHKILKVQFREIDDNNIIIIIL